MSFAAAFVNTNLVLRHILYLPPIQHISSTQPWSDSKNTYPSWPRRLLVNKKLLILEIYSVFAWIYFFLRAYVFLGLLHRDKTNPNIILGSVAYITGTCAVTITVVFLYYIEHDPEHLEFMGKQIFQVENIRKVTIPSIDRLPDFMELLGMGIGLGTPIGAFVCGFVLPLLLRLEPFASALEDLLGYIPGTLVLSFVLGFAAFYSGVVLASIVVIALAATEAFEKETRKNLYRSFDKPKQVSKSLFEKVTEVLIRKLFHILNKVSWIKAYAGRITYLQPLKPSVINSSSLFDKVRYRHNALRVVITDINENDLRTLPAFLIGIGLVAGVFLMFGMLNLYDQIELRLLWYAGVYLIVLIHFLVIFLGKYSCLPGVYTKCLLSYWKGKCVGSEDRRVLRAMRFFVFKVGSFSEVRTTMSLEILEAMYNHTVTVIISL